MATYFEHIGMEPLYGKDFVWQMFYYRTTRLMDREADSNAIAMVPPTNTTRTESQIRGLFGQLVYAGGASMLHMLRSMIRNRDEQEGALAEERKMASLLFLF